MMEPLYTIYFYAFDIYSQDRKTIISDQLERAVRHGVAAVGSDPDWESLLEVAEHVADYYDIEDYEETSQKRNGKYWEILEFDDEEHGRCVLRAADASVRMCSFESVYNGRRLHGPTHQTFRFDPHPFWNELVDFSAAFIAHMKSTCPEYANEIVRHPDGNWNATTRTWVPVSLVGGLDIHIRLIDRDNVVGI